MSRLAGKVAVVTGSGRNIGRAIAVRYAQEGAKVVVCDIVEENANDVVAKIQDAGGEAIAVRTDVSVPEEVVRITPPPCFAMWRAAATLHR